MEETIEVKLVPTTTTIIFPEVVLLSQVNVTVGAVPLPVFV